MRGMCAREGRACAARVTVYALSMGERFSADCRRSATISLCFVEGLLVPKTLHEEEEKKAEIEKKKKSESKKGKKIELKRKRRKKRSRAHFHPIDKM